jgi:hypothetical protein
MRSNNVDFVATIKLNPNDIGISCNLPECIFREHELDWVNAYQTLMQLNSLSHTGGPVYFLVFGRID